MQLTNKLHQLDECLCMYISSKDPSKKSSMNNVFMNKRELRQFYNRIQSKTKQQFMIKQTKNPHNIYDQLNEKNKLINKQQNRMYQKLYNRSLKPNIENIPVIRIKNQQCIKINTKSIINQMAQHLGDNQNKINLQYNLNNQKNKKVFKNISNKLIRSKQEEKLIKEFLTENQQFINKKKSHSHINKNQLQSLSISMRHKSKAKTNSFYEKQKGHQNNKKKEESQEMDICMPRRKVELYELYQKIYEHSVKEREQNQKISTEMNLKHQQQENQNINNLNNQIFKKKSNEMGLPAGKTTLKKKLQLGTNQPLNINININVNNIKQRRY